MLYILIYWLLVDKHLWSKNKNNVHSNQLFIFSASRDPAVPFKLEGLAQYPWSVEQVQVQLQKEEEDKVGLHLL